MNLNKLTLEDALKGLKKGIFSSEDLCRDCLTAIKAYNEPLNVFLTQIDDDIVLKQAKEADLKIKQKGPSIFDEYPLLGIPYACKDNFSTKGVKTTASSKVLADYVPPFESTVTQKLKDVGAILLGKTNMDAFAHGSSTETSDFSPTKNPWDLTRVPGGSSGGSAVAVAANMCIFAIGSETAGSIRGPASWTGITGFKPTYGRVSRYGVVAMASSTDSPGPMTKTIWDSAYVLNIIAGKDIHDATTSPLPTTSYTDEINNIDINKLTIGVPKSYFEIDMDKSISKVVREVASFFEKNGAKLVEVDLMDPKYSIAVYTILQRSEVSSNLARLSGVRYGTDRSHFGYEAKKRMMLGSYTLSSGYYDAYYTKAQKVRTLIVEDFKKVFKEVDFILGPTMPVVAMKLGESAEYPLFGEYIDMLQEPSAIAGLTAVSVPSGFVNGLPVGTQFIGSQFSEELLFKVGHYYQKNTEFHKEFPDLEMKIKEVASLDAGIKGTGGK